MAGIALHIPTGSQPLPFSHGPEPTTCGGRPECPTAHSDAQMPHAARVAATARHAVHRFIRCPSVDGVPRNWAEFALQYCVYSPEIKSACVCGLPASLGHKTQQILGEVPERHGVGRSGRFKREQHNGYLLRSVLHHGAGKTFGLTPEDGCNASFALQRSMNRAAGVVFCDDGRDLHDDRICTSQRITISLRAWAIRGILAISPVAVPSGTCHEKAPAGFCHNVINVSNCTRCGRLHDGGLEFVMR